MRGEESDRLAWSAGFNRFSHLPAIHGGHREIGYDEVEFTRLKKRQGLLSAGSGGHHMPLMSEENCHRLAHQHLIIDDEDAALNSSRSLHKTDSRCTFRARTGMRTLTFEKYLGFTYSIQMSETVVTPSPTPAVEEIQKNWPDLTLKLGNLQAEAAALGKENRELRALLERVIEHRQKSHGELVLILTSLVGKLPLNDVAVIVSRLVEHSNNTAQYLAALLKGTAEAHMMQPDILKNLEQAKRELHAALKAAIHELMSMDTPLEADMLQSLLDKPDLFFSAPVARANRCFLKGCLPRERVIRQFGEESLGFFKDLTTDPKLNPRPKPEEIALGFRDDFEAVFQQYPNAIPNKRDELMALYRKVQQSKGATEQARNQRNVFFRMSFLIELLHYYENQNTIAPDSVFAQRLPGLIEQLALTGPQDPLDEKLLPPAEALLSHITNHEHKLMVVNNLGKSGSSGKSLRFVLRLRIDKIPESDPEQVMQEFMKHLIPLQKPPPPQSVAAVIRLLPDDLQLETIHAIMDCDRLGREEADAFGKAVAGALNVKLPERAKARGTESPEIELQNAWGRIKEMISSRTDAATIATAFRDRLNAKYDSDEIKQSWLTLTEADAIALIRIFCQIPYRANGTTDPIARAVLEAYATRLVHEKYAATYHKVINSLRTMFTARPDNPTLQNFIALVRWVSPEAANKICTDIGMQVASAH